MAEFEAGVLYEEMDGNRSSTIDRAVLCSELTIPYLLREDSASAQDDLSREYVQGYGAKLVNHLVGKFALSILPPSQPFYRLSATQESIDAIAGQSEEAKFAIEKQLAIKEEGILRYINKSKFRSRLYPALRYAMVTGESIIEKVDDDRYRVFNLNNYVVKRDGTGNIVKLIIKEVLSADTLPEGVDSDVEDENEDIFLYTAVYLDEDRKYQMFQEIDGEVVAGSEQTLNKLTDRFIEVGWNKVDGEDYRRSFVEEHLGTFIELNKQLKVLSESAVVSSKTVFTVNPNGMTKYSDFVSAKNGEAIIGQEVDIGTVKVQKSSDMIQTYNLTQDLKKELAEAFLMSSASIRDAERVTAHEVQLVASELEASFGGNYTAIAEDIQIPLVESAMSTLKIDGGEDVDVIITAGVEALGRNVELSKINGLIQELGFLANLVGQEAVVPTLNVGAMTSAIVANSGVASKDFLFSQGQQDQNEIANKKEQIAQQMLQGGLPQAGANIANQATGE